MTRRGIVPAAGALAATAILVAMIVTGAAPVQRQLVRFEAKGVLRLPPGEIDRVEVAGEGERVDLRRLGEKGWATADGAGVAAEVAARISMAVQVLHASAPVRTMAPEELEGADAASFGLDPPRIAAALYGADGRPIVRVAFGGRNPEDFLQYMRVEGDPRLYLMSRFVGEEWSAAMEGARPR